MGDNSTISEPLPYDGATGEFLNGGILFVLVFDALIAFIGFALFVFVRRASMTRGDTLVTVTGQGSRWRLWYSKLLHRHSERKRAQGRSWLGWIPETISTNNNTVLEVCGRDGFLYLRFQRLLIIVLLVQTVFIAPFLLVINLRGDSEVDGFGATTANHLQPGSHQLWYSVISVVVLSVMLLVAIYRTLAAQRAKTSSQEITARLFSVKIENIPRSLKSEELLLSFLEGLYPGRVQQVYISLNMNKLQRKYSELAAIEHKVFHYEVEMTTLGHRPFTYQYGLAREICCPGFLQPKADALNLYLIKKEKVEKEIRELSNREYPSTGVCFVTFKSPEWRKQFVKDFRKTELPKSELSRELKIHKWIVTSAPAPEEIRWKSLRVGIFEYGVRVVLVNSLLLCILFFFTTPVAMIGSIQEYTSDLFEFPVISKIDNSAIGRVALGYLPSLLLLGLTFLIPHILYCKTCFDRTSS
jgi:hypothetical protein